METVTADTNIYVSALHFGGKPRQLLELAQAGRIRLAISDDIEAELHRVLRDKLAWSEERLNQLEELLPSFTMRVKPSKRLDVVQDDPTDNRVVECAVASRSSVVVSGDRHLLSLGQYEGIRVERIAEYLERREREPGRDRW